MSSTLELLAGAFPVLPTPFRDDDSLDLAGLERLVDRLLDKGVRGLTLLGSSAESTYLTEEERRRVLERAVPRLKGRATSLVGVIAFGTREAVEQGKRYRDLGADALLVALPQYYETPLSSVIAHYDAIVREVGLPTLYYHYPKPTHLDLSPEQVGKLFSEVALAGIKNSSVDTNNTLAQIRAVGRPIRMFTGQSFDCLACLEGGAAGAICPVAALMPATALGLVDKYRAGDREGAQQAQNRFYRALPFVMPEQTSEGIFGVPHAGVKEALVALGILESARIRTPQPVLSAERREQIRQIAAEIVEL